MNRTILGPVGRHLSRFHADEGGNATIEFCLFVPFFFAFFLSSFEMGMLMVRQTMLDRGVDLTVRQIRLNNLVNAAGDNEISRSNMRRYICQWSSGLIPDCNDNLRIELVRMDPHDWGSGAGSFAAGGECVNRGTPAIADEVFNDVAQNELIILRVCALIEPLSITDGIGSYMQRRSGDYIALFSISAFVVEPEQ